MGGELSTCIFKIPSSPAMPRTTVLCFYCNAIFLFFYKKKHGFVAILKYLARAVPFETFLWPQPKIFQDGGTRNVDSLLETTTLGLGELQGLGIQKKIA